MTIERHYSPGTPPAGERPQIPAERTAELFRLPVTALAARLEETDIVRRTDRGDVRLHIISPIPYPQYGPQYKDRLDLLKPGDVAIRHYVGRGLPDTNQTLIVSHPGSCIQLKRASRYDPDENKYVRLRNEGDIARALSVKDGDTLSLQYIDDSAVLYLVERAKDLPSPPTPEESQRALEQYFVE